MYEAEQESSADAQPGVRVSRRRDYRLKVYKSRLVRIVIIGLLAALLPSAFSAPSNFIELDGNVVKDGAGTYDWANSGPLAVTPTPTVVGSVFSRSGSGGVFDGGIFQGTNVPPTPPTLTAAAAGDPTITNAEFIADPLSSDTTSCSTNAGDPTTYTNGGSDKNNQPIGGFQWGTGSSQPKDELGNVYALAHLSGSTNEIFFGAERTTNNGDSHVDFEFLQSNVTTNATSAGCAPSGGGTFGGHNTEGDLLISADFGNGGAVGGVTIYRWECNGSTPGPTGVQCDPAGSTPNAQFVTATSSAVQFTFNAAPIGCGGWVCRDSSGNAVTSLDTNLFVEGGVDLAAAGFGSGCFNTFIPQTRSSGSSINSTLSDFAGPFKFSNCKTPTVATTLSSGSRSGASLTVSAGAAVTDTATLSGTAGTPGGQVTYQVFTNNTCTTPSGNPSVSQTVTLSGGVVPSTTPVVFPAGGTFFWQASYSGDVASGGKNLPAVSPCTAEVLTVNAAHITLKKTADATPVDDGMPIGFTVTATNTGAGDANTVTVTDPLPAAPGVSWVIDPPNAACAITGSVGSQVLHCNFGTLTSGQSASVHIISSTDATTGTQALQNVASVTTTNDGSDTATATVHVRAAHITLKKTADATPVNDGSPIGFVVTATNTGAAAATTVTVNDPLPAAPGVNWSIDGAHSDPGCTITGPVGSQVLQCSFGTLASGASVHVHIVSGTDGTTGMRTLQNVASVTTTNDGSDTATATVHTLAASIGITKTADATPVADGSPIGFTITVGNSGAAPATTVTVNDPLPAAPGVTWSVDAANSTIGCAITGPAGSQVLTCNFGTIASGASVHVHITSPTTGATGTQTLTNVASAATGNDGSGQSTATVHTLAASVSVAKTADQGIVSAGEPIGFTITATNTGAAAATTVTVTDTLTSPGGVVWTATPSQGSCSIAATLLTCDLGTLAPNGGTATIHLTSPTTANSCTTIDNTAFITSGNDGSGSSQQATITIECPNVIVTKTAEPATINAGDTASFQIVVTNLGPGTAATVTVHDTLPAGVPWSVTTQPNNSNPCGIAAGVLTCPLSSIGPGVSETIVVSGPASAATCGPLVNTVTITVGNEAPSDFFLTHSHSSATITVNCASIGITKTADTSPVSAGDPIGFTILVQNTGAGQATTVTVTDTLVSPPGVSWGVTSSQGSCSIVANLLTCNLGSMASGGMATIHLTSGTTRSSCTTIDNTAFVTTGNDGSGNSSASIVVQCPDIGITKTANPASINAGDTASFHIVVFNNGPGTAATVTVHDPLPSGVTWTITSQPAGNPCSIAANVLTCDLGAMAANTSLTIDIAGPTTAANCGTLNNRATVTAPNEPNTDQIGSSASITVNCASIGVTKTADASPVSAGDPIGFTILVQNTGAGLAHGVVVTDTLQSPGGVSWTVAPSQGSCSLAGSLLTCDLGDLAANGGTASIHLTSPTTASSCTTIDNTAFVTTSNDGSGSSSASIDVLCPNVGVTKTAVTGTIDAGGTAAFQLQITNPGPGGAAGVSLNDPLPGGLAWQIVSQSPVPACSIQGGTLTCAFLSLGANVTFTVVVSAPTTKADCGPLVNNVTVTATNQLTSSTSQATVQVNCPQIGVTKTADASPVSAGDPIGFSITVTNSGAGLAHGVVVTDTLQSPGGVSWTVAPSQGSCSLAGSLLTCDLGDLAANGGTASIHLTSPTTASSCTTIDNTAFVTTSNDGSGSSSASIDVQCPNVTVTKTAVAGMVSAGDQAAFQIVVSNAGPGTAHGVAFNDPLPGTLAWNIVSQTSSSCAIQGGSLDCNIGTMVAGTTFTVVVAAPTTKASCGPLVNDVTVTVTNQITQPTAQATVTVNCPNLTITKTADASPVSAGDPIGFTITATNTGPGTAHGVIVTDTLQSPAGVSWTVSGASCSIAGSLLTCSLGDLGPGQSVTIHLTSPTTPFSCGTINNTAFVSDPGDLRVTNLLTDIAFVPVVNPDPTSSSASIDVLCPNLGVTKTAVPSTITAGSDAVFSIVVANSGPGTAQGVSLTDELPTGLTWTVSVEPPMQVNPCVVTGGVLHCSFGDMGVNTAVTVTLTAPTTPANCGMIPNTATVGAANQLSMPESQAIITVVCPQKPPVIHVHKKADDNPESAGDQIGFTIEVSNSGGSDATGVVLSDPLPTAPGIHWTIDGSVPGCSISGNTLTCTRASLGSGDSFTVHVVSNTTYLAFCDTLHNTARVTTDNAGSDESSADIHIKCAHITVTKKADDNPESRGDQIGFTITVKNTGEDGLLNPRLVDPLPGGTGIHWTIANPVAGCSIAGNTLTCQQAWLDPEGGSFTVHVVSDTTFQTECTTLENTARVTSTNGGADESSAEIHIKCAALSVDKHADSKSVTEGGQIGFTITVKNTGDDGMLNPRLVDPLPTGDGVQWMLATPVAGCSISGNTLTCQQAWLDPDGGSFTVHVISQTGPSSCGTYDNHATASSTNSGDARDSAELQVTGCPASQGSSTLQDNSGPGTDVLGKQFTRDPGTVDQVVPAITHALLPFTGFNAVGTGLIALAMLAAGGVLCLIARKRKA